MLPGANQSEVEKFQRLMGNNKNPGGSLESQEEEAEAQRQLVLNKSLMAQYDMARSATHFNRGTGLGYSTTMYQPR